MACIVQIPGLSPLAPITSVLPLVFVIGATMIKQFWEDMQRAAADRAVNYQPAHAICADGTVADIVSQQVQVGDVLLVRAGEEFPCDLILLSTDDVDSGEPVHNHLPTHPLPAPTCEPVPSSRATERPSVWSGGH